MSFQAINKSVRAEQLPPDFDIIENTIFADAVTKTL
jgi:hypothetical protein